MIEQPADLAYLGQPTGGEQLYLRILRDGRWSDPIAVTDGKHELYRPAVSVAGDGRVWVFYSAHLDADKNLDHGNWELLARSFEADGERRQSRRSTSSHTAGTDFMPAAATDARGQVWVTWVGGRGGELPCLRGDRARRKFSAPERVSQFAGQRMGARHRRRSRGNLAVALGHVRQGRLRRVRGASAAATASSGKPQAVAASLAFEVRPSLAYDATAGSGSPTNTAAISGARTSAR